MIDIKARTDPARAREVLGVPLVFGQALADLMVTVHHDVDRGWHDAAVVATAPLQLSPAAKVLHYGLEIFEGHKAYRWPGDEVALFRPELNARRLNRSARRLGMPDVPEELQLTAVELLVHLLRGWVPGEPGTSLYLRPALIGTDAGLGVGPSRTHLYFVIASPVGPFFPRGFAEVSILVEEEQSRAAAGGVGAAKAGGNYAAGIPAQERARLAGFDQVLWLDAAEHRYIEELNAMNVILVRGQSLLTPPLGGTILPGITRRSILELAPDLGLEAREVPLALEEVIAQIESGAISEMFAVGTAAVITPVGCLGHGGRRITVGSGKAGPVSRRVHETVTGIQFGQIDDPYSWMRIVPRPA